MNEIYQIKKLVHESDNWYGLDGFSDVPDVPPASSEIDESLIRSDYPRAFEAIGTNIFDNISDYIIKNIL